MNRKQILEDTIKYYSEDINRRCTYKNGCFYNPIKAGKKGISEGCAVGRLIPQRLRSKLDNLEGGTGVSNDNVFNMLPKKIQKLGQDFLTDLQELHDVNAFWDDKGLTELGKTRVNGIEIIYGIQ